LLSIIFTDLDGSLLGHSDYSYEAALPSLERIRKARIPLIITTSKTRIEVEWVQREIGIIDPFIVENGGGIFIPGSSRLKEIKDGEKHNGYTLIRLGKSYSYIRELFGKIASRFGIRGFGDMTSEEIAVLTGMSVAQAGRAKLRQFTEPFLADNNQDIKSIEDCALSIGLKIARGGRFYHLMDFAQDKGLAVKKLIDLYQKNSRKGGLISIGIGDSENDLPMLEQVDIPVLIPNPDSRHRNIDMPGLVRAEAPGPLGWNSAVESILNKIYNAQL